MYNVKVDDLVDYRESWRYMVYDFIEGTALQENIRDTSVQPNIIVIDVEPILGLGTGFSCRSPGYRWYYRPRDE